ncbi:hypothetical protein [Pseudomonas sp. TH31]|uniref:hypothetical protein n=1 Tax=Pseudomonas sp. TH31 TaxID=2796396 RepID=UPI001F5BBCC9|nr:hypothetical protein [Pseudomonas sp. TH31]
MSALGILHTTLSMVPFIAGAYGFFRHGRIDPASQIGRWYQYSMLASVITAFGLSSTGGFNSGHALGILALTAIFLGRNALHLRPLGRAREYLQVSSMTFSYLVLMIPGLNETLSRLPVGNPIGHGPDSPQVKAALLVALLVFLLGLSYQLLRLRARLALLQSSYQTHG